MELVVRESSLCKRQVLSDVVEGARKLLSGIEGPSMGVWLLPFHDSLSVREMHDRFFVAKTGALEFGRGFQEFYDGRSARISVVGRQFHQLLLSLYYDGGHDFRIPDGVPPGGIRLV